MNQLSRQRVNVFRPVYRREEEEDAKHSDPLAQSFTVDEQVHFFLQLIYTLQMLIHLKKSQFKLEHVELGTPTENLAANHAEVVLEPSHIVTSTDASIATKVTFPSPIYLEPDTRICYCCLAPTSNLYELWVARMGERTVNTTTLPDAESVLVTKQYIGGSLFKSQNGTIWTASQFEDMKFKLYKCNFSTTSGTAFFYNPKQDIDSPSSF